MPLAVQNLAVVHHELDEMAQLKSLKPIIGDNGSSRKRKKTVGFISFYILKGQFFFPPDG